MPPGRDAFERLLSAPGPVFRCAAAGSRAADPIIVPIHYVLGEPATSDALATIRERLGARARDFADFYADHDGALLFADQAIEHIGIAILPVAEWDEATDEMREGIESMIEAAGGAEHDPDFLRTAIVFGEVPGSGNYFAVPTEGPYAGAILYTDHETYGEAFAATFDEFLARISRDPAALLSKELGCYTRYFDGTSNTQYYPIAYADSADGLAALDAAEPRPASVIRADDDE